MPFARHIAERCPQLFRLQSEHVVLEHSVRPGRHSSSVVHRASWGRQRTNPARERGRRQPVNTAGIASAWAIVGGPYGGQGHRGVVSVPGRQHADQELVAAVLGNVGPPEEDGRGIQALQDKLTKLNAVDTRGDDGDPTKRWTWKGRLFGKVVRRCIAYFMVDTRSQARISTGWTANIPGVRSDHKMMGQTFRCRISCGTPTNYADEDDNSRYDGSFDMVANKSARKDSRPTWARTTTSGTSAT